MSSTNQSPEYLAAQKRYLNAQTDEERLLALEEMLRTMPQHKGAESMRANLRTRYKKLEEKIESKKKASKGKGKPGIKKEGLQAVLIGLSGSGKSSILSSLTNANPFIADYNYVTRTPLLGTIDYKGVKIQLVDLPAIDSEYFDQGVANTADVLLLVIRNTDELEKINPLLSKTSGKKLIVLNKIDSLSESERRKIESRLKTKKLDFIPYSAKTKENLLELQERIFLAFGKIRVYTKQPKKEPDREPVILEFNSTIKDIAEKIFHGLSSQIREARVTGPSSKFPNQKVGLDHILKDKDIVEFRV